MAIFDSITNFLSGGNAAKASGANQAATDALRGLELPDTEKMRLQLEEMVQQGILSPEQAQVYLLEPSKMNEIATDPGLKQAQLDALYGLQDISESGGMTASDKANLNRIKTDEQTAARGARDAIAQNAAARGVGGSGLEMMLKQQADQDAINRQSQRDLDVAGTAQDRALQSLMQAGQLGGQIQAQDFGQKADIAKANDAIAQFNAANRTNVGMTNTKARNDAAAANLAEKQRVADQNIATRNMEQQYNKELGQRNYENAYKKAGGVSNALTNQAQGFQQQGQATQNLIGSVLGAGATAAAKSDENSKKDIERFDPSKFLDDITSVKYNYKNPERDGKGKQVGVMAQEIEKEVPQMVIDTPEGKMVDYNKAGGPIFASLSDIHERLKKMENKKA